MSFFVIRDKDVRKLYLTEVTDEQCMVHMFHLQLIDSEKQKTWFCRSDIRKMNIWKLQQMPSDTSLELNLAGKSEVKRNKSHS